MTEKIESQLITRRTAVSLLAVTDPLTLLTVSDAQAQTPGMERREDRRENRQERREDRQGNRQERREDRRTGRDQSATTGINTGNATGTNTGK